MNSEEETNLKIERLAILLEQMDKSVQRLTTILIGENGRQGVTVRLAILEDNYKDQKDLQKEAKDERNKLRQLFDSNQIESKKISTSLVISIISALTALGTALVQLLK